MEDSSWSQLIYIYNIEIYMLIKNKNTVKLPSIPLRQLEPVVDPDGDNI